MSSKPGSQSGCLDPLDSLLDLSEYETLSSYQSPSISPSNSGKTPFTRPLSASPTANNTMAAVGSQQTLSGPSHQYDMYKQQTPLPSGAIANTLAVNSNNVHINSQFAFGMDFGFGAREEMIDFGTAPSQIPFTGASDMDMDFESPAPEPAYFFAESSGSSSAFVDPSSMAASNTLPAQSTSNVGRLWPGMHQQQAALAKAQAQQNQQQQLIQQQRRQNGSSQQQQQQQQQQQRPRPRAQHAADPIVEEKISQLLNSMRQNSVATSEADFLDSNDMSNAQRMKKDEEDMDEDERLLASEEGKKLSSKERRQLRNKVSARAFRSRRKEYIGQLEGEIAGKVNENTDLRSENKALREENQRLSDLTRMLLASPSFSGFLDTLSQNPAAVVPKQQQQHQQQQQQQPQAPAEQSQTEKRKVRKDINPYTVNQQQQQYQHNVTEHVGMTLIPEQTMDFSMLDLGTDGFVGYHQPTVFAVLEVPEVAFVDAAALAGKSSNFPTGETLMEKVEMPAAAAAAVVERAALAAPAAAPSVASEDVLVDEEFDTDPAFALFATAAAATPSRKNEAGSERASDEETETVRVTTLEADEEELDASVLRRAQRYCSLLDAMAKRLEAYAKDL